MRVEPPYGGEEREMLIGFLDYFRETMILKTDGLTDEQLRWTPIEGANSLLGLLNHLCYVEEGWFRDFADEPYELPDIFSDDRDADFKPPPEQTLAFTVDRYRSRCEHSNRIARAAALDDVMRRGRGKEKGITLRWILIHMIEETARHAGHADITRQMLDGATGD